MIVPIYIVLLFLSLSQLSCWAIVFRAPFLLRQPYRVKGNNSMSFVVRQVPGDGGCLFHSIAAWISFVQEHKIIEFDWRMRYASNKLRRLAVDTLLVNQTICLENGETTTTEKLLELASSQYNLTPVDYCREMRRSATWGGGPEIAALSHHFKCPIHIYKLSTKGWWWWRRTFVLELSMRFGSPVFDDCIPIQLLFADGRFPNILPGLQKDTGDHFLALFPLPMALLAQQTADNDRRGDHDNNNQQHQQKQEEDGQSHHLRGGSLLPLPFLGGGGAEVKVVEPQLNSFLRHAVNIHKCPHLLQDEHFFARKQPIEELVDKVGTLFQQDRGNGDKAKDKDAAASPRRFR